MLLFGPELADLTPQLRDLALAFLAYPAQVGGDAVPELGLLLFRQPDTLPVADDGLFDFLSRRVTLNAVRRAVLLLGQAVSRWMEQLRSWP